MGCGQVVRRLPLEQETVGSTPTTPARMSTKGDSEESIKLC